MLFGKESPWLRVSVLLLLRSHHFVRPLEGAAARAELVLLSRRGRRPWRQGALWPQRYVRGNELLGRLDRDRTREEEALRVRAAQALQLLRLLLVLDTFGDHPRVERSRQRQDALDDRRPVRLQEILHERPIDLQRVD